MLENALFEKNLSNDTRPENLKKTYKLFAFFWDDNQIFLKKMIIKMSSLLKKMFRYPCYIKIILDIVGTPVCFRNIIDNNKK